MNIRINEEIRRIIIKTWNNLSKALATSKDQNTQTIKDDIEQLTQHLERADISSGVIQFTQEQHDDFTHAYSYLGEGWKPQRGLNFAEFVVYNKFVDEFFEADTHTLILQSEKELKGQFLKFLTLVDRVVPPNNGEDTFVTELIEDILYNYTSGKLVSYVEKKYSGGANIYLNSHMRLERFYQYFKLHQEKIPEFSDFPNELYDQFLNINGGIEYLKRYFIEMAIDENNERYTDDKKYIFDELKRLQLLD